MKSMISKRHCAVAAAALCLLANALAANTTLPLTIERVANARNILTGSGKADGAPVQDSQNRLIALIAPFESEPPSIAKAARGVDSTVMTAPPPRAAAPFAAQADTSNGLFAASPGLITGGIASDSGAGQADAMAINPAENVAWAPVGSSGDVRWRSFAMPVIAGIWQINAPTTQIVFEAASIALFGLGLASFGLGRRSRFSQR